MELRKGNVLLTRFCIYCSHRLKAEGYCSFIPAQFRFHLKNYGHKKICSFSIHLSSMLCFAYSSGWNHVYVNHRIALVHILIASLIMGLSPRAELLRILSD